MDEELDYLWETLGLEITADLWPERGQNPSHTAPRHYCGAGKIPPCILFDHADVMARGTPRP